MRGDDALTADDLLGELPEADRAAMERRVDADAAFADAVARMRRGVEGLDAMPALGWSAGESPAPAAVEVAIGALVAGGGEGDAPRGPAPAPTPPGGAGPSARGEARVSPEPAGGDPAHSGDSVLRGPTGTA